MRPVSAMGRGQVEHAGDTRRKVCVQSFVPPKGRVNETAGVEENTWYCKNVLWSGAQITSTCGPSTRAMHVCEHACRAVRS